MKKTFCTILIIVLGISIIWFFLPNKEQVPTLSQNLLEEKIYVAVEGTGKIAIIDAKTQKKIKDIDLSEVFSDTKVQYMAHNVQVSPDNKSVWVTANAMESMEKMAFSIIPKAYAEGDHDEADPEWNDQVIVIDPLTDTIIKRIDMGKGLHLAHVSITPDSKYAIVASQEKGKLYKINTDSFLVESSVETKQNGGPHWLRVSPDGENAYIAMLDGKSMGILTIVDMQLSDIPLKGSAVQTGVTPDGKYALASVYTTKSLAVYNIATGKESYVDLPEEAKGPLQLYPTPDSRFVYVADQGYYFDQPNGDTVYKIDLLTMEVVKEIKVGSAPHGLVISLDGAFVYVTNLLSDDVSIIDTITDTEIAKIEVGENPNGISVWYGNRLPISNNKTGSLTVENKLFDFGIVSMSKGDVQHSFKIKNPDNSPVKITKIYTSCMCTQATLILEKSNKWPFGMPGSGGLSPYINVTVMPGEEFSIQVVVDPSAHGPKGTGAAKKVIYIETDSVMTPKIELVVDINVTP